MIVEESETVYPTNSLKFRVPTIGLWFHLTDMGNLNRSRLESLPQQPSRPGKYV